MMSTQPAHPELGEGEDPSGQMDFLKRQIEKLDSTGTHVINTDHGRNISIQYDPVALSEVETSLDFLTYREQANATLLLGEYRQGFRGTDKIQTKVITKLIGLLNKKLKRS